MQSLTEQIYGGGIDQFAFIPLFAIIAVLGALCIFLLFIKIRRTAKVGFSPILSLAVVIAGCLHTIFSPNLSRFASFVYFFIAAVVSLPYCIMLAFERKSKKTDIVTQLNSEEKLKEELAKVKELSVTEINLLETGCSIFSKATSAFSKEDGDAFLFDEINKTLMKMTHAEGGAVLIVDDFDDIVCVKSFVGNFPPPYELPKDLPHKPLRVSTSFKFAQFPFKGNIFGEIVSSGKPELIENSAADERIFQNAPEEFLKTGSYIFVPMKSGNSVTGLLALAKSATSEPFDECDFDCAKTLGNFASAAINSLFGFNTVIERNEMTKETTIAHKMQDLINPKKLPILAGMTIGNFFDFSSGVVGDFFDIIPSRKDRVSFVLGDIAGKGMNSLMVIIMIRAMIRLVVNTTQSAATILGWANRGICSETALDHFGSVALMNFDPTKRKFQIATGGTTPVYLFSAKTKQFKQVSQTFEPIGVEKTTAYKDIEFTVQTGDLVVSFTDGVIEALNAEGKQYSIENLKNVIIQSADLSGKDIAQKIKNDMKKFLSGEKLHDDQTLLVLKIQ